MIWFDGRISSLQNLSTTAGPNSRPANVDGRKIFAAASIFLVVASVLLAGLSPVLFSVAIVVVFGAPHNWVEFRYVLSRLPSRLGPFRGFFLTSFIGAILLCITEIVMMFLVQENAISVALARQLVLIWNEFLILWIFALSFSRYPKSLKETALIGGSLTAIMTEPGSLPPQVFTLAIVYVHPAVGLWIFERELRRTRKSWLKTYHLCMLTVPAAVLLLIFWLSGTTYDAAYARSLSELSGNVGTNLFKSASPAVLLAVYGFLQMVHYGVWVFAMPLATRSWERWRFDRLPALKNRLIVRTLCGYVFGLGAVALCAFWVGFKLDYASTMNLYVFLSTLHVLAEVPFMFWMCDS